jgi:hypothetical protein
LGGYKTAVPGTTITAADQNTYVRDQVIGQFASYSALTSAITAPVAGMMAYLGDTGTYWYYRGTAWRLVAGQLMYSKWDTATSFFTNVAAGAYTTAFTSATFNIPSSGTGQAFEVYWQCPHSSGSGTVTRYNSLVQASVNAGAFNNGANAGANYVNSVADSWVTRGAWIYKAAGADTTMALRVQSISVGGTFDCIGSVDKAFVLTMKSMGLLASEVS